MIELKGSHLRLLKESVSPQACDVDPEASPVLNCCVCLPNGKLLMNLRLKATREEVRYVSRSI